MQFKKKLLSGVIASAVTFAMIGSANAVEIISFELDNVVGGAHLYNGPTAPLFVPPSVANEIIPTADTTVGDDRDDGAARVIFDVETGTFPSGNVLFTIGLSGATFDGASVGGWFDFTGCTTPATAVLSTTTTTSATFVVSNLNGCLDGENPVVNVPFDADGGAPVAMTFGIVTESGNAPVDGGPVTFTILNNADAFRADIDAGATLTSAVASTGGAYRRFAGNTVGPVSTGDIELQARSNTYVDLDGGGTPTVAGIADVTAAVATFTGNFSSFISPPGTTGAVTVGGLAPVVTAGSAVIDSGVTPLFLTNLVTVGTAFDEGADEAVLLTANGTTPIAASTYSVSIAATAVPGLLIPARTGALAPIVRDGTNATLAWTASNTQSAGTGSQNFVRVSNPTSSAYGVVTATVLATTGGVANATAVMAASVPANGEILFTAAQLEAALGNFGRGDILISVEGNGAIIKRLVQRTDGTYEINNN